MKFSAPLIPARLIRRYKRFLADVEMADGRVITVHTPNTGSMLGCSDPGSRIWLRDSNNPKRKYRYSWDMTETGKGVLVGVNTAIPNQLVPEAIEKGVIIELQGYENIRQEVRYGKENSRIDLLLTRAGKPECYVEIKNVTTCDEQGFGFFPDAVSTRATKHLRELMGVVKEGRRAVLCFCVQRGDVEKVRPADEIDPDYGKALRQALVSGVEAIAYRAQILPDDISLVNAVPVNCPS